MQHRVHPSVSVPASVCLHLQEREKVHTVLPRPEALDLADIDGSGDIDALTDGLLTLRYLFGLQGDTLINGVVAGDATRTTAEEIEAHLETLMPAL